MQEKQIEKLNRLLELVQNDTVTPKEIEQFLNVVVNLITKERENFNSASASSINKIESALEFINSKYSETIESLLEEKKSTSAEFSKQVDEVKNLISELHAIKTTPGSDGKDADEEAIIESVLNKIEFPEHEKFELIGEDIVERINELPIDEDEYKIDFEHIKGIKEYVKENAVSTNIISNSNKYIKELLDVDLSGVTYNTTTKKYELGSGGGGGLTALNNGQGTTWNATYDGVDLGGTYDTNINIISPNSSSFIVGTSDGSSTEANFQFADANIGKICLNQKIFDFTYGDWAFSEIGIDAVNYSTYMSQYNFNTKLGGWESNQFRVYSDKIQSDKYRNTRDDSATHVPINYIYTNDNGDFMSAPLGQLLLYVGIIDSFNANYLTANAELTSSSVFNSLGTSFFYGGATFNNTTTFNSTSFFSGGISSTIANAQNVSLTNTQSGANGFSAINVAQTWNTTGNPKAIFANITNTASGAASLLMDLQVGGVSQFSVSKAGNTAINGTLSINNQLSIAQASGMRWNNRSRMYSDASGTIRLMNSALTDFDRLQFGGSTSSFPSLKRSGTGLISRLADDSADAPFTASNLISTTTVRLKGYTVATLPAGTQGDTAYCTDLLTPGFLATAVGGGSNVAPVFYNGTNWVTY